MNKVRMRVNLEGSLIQLEEVYKSAEMFGFEKLASSINYVQGCIRQTLADLGTPE